MNYKTYPKDTSIKAVESKIVIKQYFDSEEHDFVQVELDSKDIVKINKCIQLIAEKNSNLFDAFYSAYPKKRKKTETKKKWTLLKCDLSFKEIMIGLTKWKKSKDWDDPQFVPYPTTFLNQKYWEEPPVIGKKQTRTWDNVR